MEEIITYSQSITQSIKQSLKNHLHIKADETEIMEEIHYLLSINYSIKQTVIKNHLHIKADETEIMEEIITYSQSVNQQIN